MRFLGRRRGTLTAGGGWFSSPPRVGLNPEGGRRENQRTPAGPPSPEGSSASHQGTCPTGSSSGAGRAGGSSRCGAGLRGGTTRDVRAELSPGCATPRRSARVPRALLLEEALVVRQLLEQLLDLSKHIRLFVAEVVEIGVQRVPHE